MAHLCTPIMVYTMLAMDFSPFMPRRATGLLSDRGLSICRLPPAVLCGTNRSRSRVTEAPAVAPLVRRVGLCSETRASFAWSIDSYHPLSSLVVSNWVAHI